jgi:hypothetical protein
MLRFRPWRIGCSVRSQLRSLAYEDRGAGVVPIQYASDGQAGTIRSRSSGRVQRIRLGEGGVVSVNWMLAGTAAWVSDSSIFNWDWTIDEVESR